MSMRMLGGLGFCFALCCFAFIQLPLQGKPKPQQSASASQSQDAARDGQHDFDPLIGHWKYTLKRRLRPLTGSNEWAEYEGTGTCRKIWDGSEIEQAAFDGPKGHVEGFVIRLYKPESHQWRLYWTSRNSGIFDPPQIGEFKNGRGVFVAQDTINGKTILIRVDKAGHTVAPF